MKNILVPVDLSPAAAKVCEEARTLARLIRARLVILHIQQLLPVMLNEYYAMDATQVAVAAAAGEKFSARRIAELGQRMKRGGQSVKTVHLSGEPVTAILAQAKANAADYIVLGSHGHGAIYDLFVGSTTQGVLKKAACPVLIVPVRSPGRRKR